MDGFEIFRRQKLWDLCLTSYRNRHHDGAVCEEEGKNFTSRYNKIRVP